jgi:hypothetical protein
MATVARETAKLPLATKIAFFVVLAIGLVIVYFTYGLATPAWLRWGVTILWVGVTVAFAIHDFLLPNSGGGRDDRIVDYWTISHGGAGLVFGLWYIPLVFVVVLVVMWEIYERLFPGVGDKEIFANYAMDIGIAIVMWFVVVIITVLTTGAGFPLLSPVLHP